MADRPMYLAEAVHRFMPVEPHDLALEVGDTIEVMAVDVAELGVGWNMGRVSGQVGFYPAAYAEKVQKAQLSAAAGAAALAPADDRDELGNALVRSTTRRRPAGRGAAARQRNDSGASDYTDRFRQTASPQPDVPRGKEKDSDWEQQQQQQKTALASFGARAGAGLLRTASAVQRIDSAPSPPRERAETQELNLADSTLAEPIYVAQAMYDYVPPPEAEHAHDLPFRKGDIVDVLQDVVEELGEGWSLGRLRPPLRPLASKEPGFFPTAYVQAVQVSSSGAVGEAAEAEQRERARTAEMPEPHPHALLYLAEASYDYLPPRKPAAGWEEHEHDLRFTKGAPAADS